MAQRIDWSQAANLPPAELASLIEEDHDEIDDNPPATGEQLAAARPGTRRPGQRGPGRTPALVQLAIRIEPDTLAALKAQGPGWQKNVRSLLRKAARTRKS